MLSIEEVVQYFGDSGQLQNRPEVDIGWGAGLQPALSIDDRYNSARIAIVDDNATISEWAWVSFGETSQWWLRTPGFRGNDAAVVGERGIVNLDGESNHFDDGIRPALWLNMQP